MIISHNFTSFQVFPPTLKLERKKYPVKEIASGETRRLDTDPSNQCLGEFYERCCSNQFVEGLARCCGTLENKKLGLSSFVLFCFPILHWAFYLVSNGSMGNGVEGTLGDDDLAVSSVGFDLAVLLELQVLSALDASEAPGAGDVDLLTSRELELGTTEALHSVGNVLFEGTDGHEDLSNVNAGNEAIRLTEGTTHTGLETIRTGAGQHLVDTQDVEGVSTDAQVETFLTAHLHGILVGADTGSLESLRRDVLVFARNQVDSVGELVNTSLLTTAVVDAKLSIRDTTAEAGLGVGLVLDEAVANERRTKKSTEANLSSTASRRTRSTRQHSTNKHQSHTLASSAKETTPSPLDSHTEGPFGTLLFSLNASSSLFHVPASRTSSHLGVLPNYTQAQHRQE